MRHLRRLAIAAAISLCAGAASADIPASRDDFQLNARTVIVVVGFAMVGGLVSWIAKVRSGAIAAWSLFALVGELCTSAFAGFLCYMLCDQFGLSTKLSIFLVGIAGHMGPRAISSFEAYAARRWGEMGTGVTERTP